MRKTVNNYVYPANRSPCLSKNYRPSEIASKCINSKSSILFRLHCSLTQNVFYASFNNPQTQRTFLLGLWLWLQWNTHILREWFFNPEDEEGTKPYIGFWTPWYLKLTYASSFEIYVVSVSTVFWTRHIFFFAIFQTENDLVSFPSLSLLQYQSDREHIIYLTRYLLRVIVFLFGSDPSDVLAPPQPLWDSSRSLGCLKLLKCIYSAIGCVQN